MFGWIFKGKMEVKLPQLQFNAGDKIQGTLIYSVKKPQTTKSTSVRLYAVEKRVSGYGSNRSVRTFTIFDFELPLKQAEQLVPGQQYEVPFEIGIPNSLVNQTQGPENEIAQTVMRAASMITQTRRNVNWYIKGRVDLPGFDITKNIKINVI